MNLKRDWLIRIGVLDVGDTRQGHGKATWWVYEDRRKHISRRPGDLSPDIWIDCPGCECEKGPATSQRDPPFGSFSGRLLEINTSILYFMCTSDRYITI